MTTHLYPLLFGLVVWWASTVLIIWLDGLPRATFKWSMAGATLVLAAALWGLHVTSRQATPVGAYIAFTCGVMAWGWQEMSFYMGFLTGTRKTPCAEGCGGFPHFVHAVQTSLWHELAIIGSCLLVFALTWGGVNQIGAWTFLVLWWMHQSAKLNVFFGVRNLNAEFLPEHLGFLKGFLTKKPMNNLFPVSVTVSTVITAWLLQRAFAPGASPFQAVGLTFVGVFMALAVLEHWLLVAPMPSAALWAPGLKSRRSAPAKPFDAEVVVGFLGAGKTTFLKRVLAEADPAVKTVVLVNDFGELGLDAGLLSGQGAEVVELPNGCICCSLKADLGAQLQSVLKRQAPDRILIEPSGVADVAALLAVLHQPAIAPSLRSLKVFTVIDAAAFRRDYARLPDYFDAQTRLAPVFILSKLDLVGPAERRLVEETLAALNPRARILPARFGVVEGLSGIDAAPASEGEHAHDHAHGHEEAGVSGLGFQSWSRPLAEEVAVAALSDLLERLRLGEFGAIERLKGLARTADGWIRFDIAGGRVHLSAHRPAADEVARVMVIGQDLAVDALAPAFDQLSDTPATPLLAAE